MSKTPSNIQGIRGNTPPGQPNERVVSLLEEALEQAKRGEITGCAIAKLDFQGCGTTGWAHQSQYFDLIGVVSVLQYRLLAE